VKKRVYVVSRGFHDWEPAAKFGEVVFLAKTRIPRDDVSLMMRMFSPLIKKSHRSDYIVVTGLTIMNMIAGVLFALRHKRLNLLVWLPDKGRYEERVILFDNADEGSINKMADVFAKAIGE